MDKEIFIAGDFFEDFQLNHEQQKYDMEYIRRINEKYLTKEKETSEIKTSEAPSNT